MKTRMLVLTALATASIACSSERERAPAVNPNVDAFVGDVYQPDLGTPMPDAASDATDATADVIDATGDATDASDTGAGDLADATPEAASDAATD